MVDLSSFVSRANLYLQTAAFEVQGDAREAFREELSKAGFTPPALIELGKLQRISAPNDKPHKKSGWVVYNEFSDEKHEGKVLGVGVYGSWKGHPERVTWTSRSADIMSQSERLHYMAQIELAKAARDADERQRWSEAAIEAMGIWSNATECPSDHPYLVKKKIKPAGGIRLSRESIAVPVMIEDHIASIQFIRPDGSKKFLLGGRTKGASFHIKGKEDLVIIAEGYSTAASIYEATGATVYVAFSADNLYEVASQVKRKHRARIIIAGDDDRYTEGNKGRTKATQAAEGLEIEVVFPIFKNTEGKFTDFNDLHVDQGIKAVKNFFIRDIMPDAYTKPVHDYGAYQPPVGIIRDIFDFYNATSGNKQPGFAVQTALAICSVVTGRSYKTNKENFSSLYFLNVGKSSTGKEHAKTVTEQVLAAANMEYLITGDGYTSGGAVFSALLDRPRHISVIDEFGRYLEAGSASKLGNNHQREANTKLMESIGRAHQVMRPPTYSTMTVKKDAADALKNRRVYNPSITLLTMTTPATLFKTLDINSVKDGFINRFIISISDAERTIRTHKDPIPVPESIKDWIISIENRAQNKHIAAEPPKFTVLDFSLDSLALQDNFQVYCIQQADALDKFGMAELTGRANEMAMRIAMICALSRDAEATVITAEDMNWAISYVRSCLDSTVGRLKMTISSSDFEGHKKEVLQALRDSSPEWVKFSTMNKAHPYTKHQRKYLTEILDSLVDAELIDVRQANVEGRGRPSKEFRAIE